MGLWGSVSSRSTRRTVTCTISPRRIRWRTSRMAVSIRAITHAGAVMTGKLSFVMTAPLDTAHCKMCKSTQLYHTLWAWPHRSQKRQICVNFIERSTAYPPSSAAGDILLIAKRGSYHERYKPLLSVWEPDMSFKIPTCPHPGGRGRCKPKSRAER